MADCPVWGVVSGASGLRWRKPVLVGSPLAFLLGWSAQGIAAAWGALVDPATGAGSVLPVLSWACGHSCICEGPCCGPPGVRETRNRVSASSLYLRFSAISGVSRIHNPPHSGRSDAVPPGYV